MANIEFLLANFQEMCNDMNWLLMGMVGPEGVAKARQINGLDWLNRV